MSSLWELCCVIVLALAPALAKLAPSPGFRWDLIPQTLSHPASRKNYVFPQIVAVPGLPPGVWMYFFFLFLIFKIYFLISIFSFPYLVTDVYSCILRSRFSCTSIFSYSCLFSSGEYSLTDKCLRTIFHLRNICLSESDQRIL